jgi:hypothetical protein
MEKKLKIKGTAINRGVFQGEALVSKTPFGFLGAVETTTGIVIDKRHELVGQNMANKVLVFPEGRGSTVGAIIILELARCGTSPGAIVNRTTEPILASGAILAKKFYHRIIPVIHHLAKDPIAHIRTGDIVRVDADRGEITIFQKG